MFQIEISKCRYKVQGIEVNRLWPTPSMQVEEGPILVSQLDNHEYYVEDGRHRLIRAQLHGKALIDAEWYEDWLDAKLAEETSAAIKKVLAGPFGRPVRVDREATVEDVRKNLQYHHMPTGGNSYPSFNDTPPHNTGTKPYDLIVLAGGAIVRPRQRLVDGNVVDRNIPTSYRAKCGRDYLHEAHDFGEHMEERCNGRPAPSYL
jgi:hypothetical protein